MVGAGDVLGDAYVNVLAETNTLQSGFSRAYVMANIFSQNMGKTIAIGIGAALAGVGGIVIASLRSWMQAEVVSRRLADTMGMMGVNTEKVIPGIDRYADAVARKTKYDDEDVKTMIQKGYALGKSTEEVEKLSDAAVGLSTRLGMDLSTSMRLLIRASEGNTRMFSRMGVHLDKTATKAQQFAQILKFSKEGLKMAEGETQTLSGSLSMLHKSVGETFESFGQGIERSVAFTSAVQSLSKWFWNLKDALDNAMETGKFSEWVDTIVGGFRFMWNDISAGFKTIFIPLQVLGDVVVAFFYMVLKGAFDMGQGIVATFIWLTENAQTLWNNLTTNVAVLMTDMYETVKRIVSNMQTIWKNATDNIGNWLAEMWAKAKGEKWNMGDLTKNLLEGTKGLTEGGLNLTPMLQGTTEYDSRWIDDMAAVGKMFADTITGVPDNFKKRFAKIADDWMKANKDVASTLGKGLRDSSGLKGKGEAPKEVQEKIKTSIFGFSDWWKKAQESTGKDKIAKDSLTQLKEINKAVSKDRLTGSVWEGSEA